MPEISRFYGIIIKIFFKDHNPPHFHAVYNEHNGLFDINTLELIEGDLPERSIKLIQEWGTIYQNELISMWNEQKLNKLPGLN